MARAEIHRRVGSKENIEVNMNMFTIPPPNSPPPYIHKHTVAVPSVCSSATTTREWGNSRDGKTFETFKECCTLDLCNSHWLFPRCHAFQFGFFIKPRGTVLSEWNGKSHVSTDMIFSKIMATAKRRQFTEAVTKLEAHGLINPRVSQTQKLKIH